jgi:hypothetical protein
MEAAAATSREEAVAATVAVDAARVVGVAAEARRHRDVATADKGKLARTPLVHRVLCVKSFTRLAIV